MPIEFHCHHCDKLVRAPDEAGGKRGKCPSCGNVLYIPMPDDQVEDIPLAPFDEGEERRRRQVEEEALRTERGLLKEKQAGPDTGPARPIAEPPMPGPIPGGDQNPEDVEFLVVEWVRSMADGNLGDADRALMVLRGNRKATLDAAQKLAVMEPPPPGLTDVPRPVLNRYFRMLRERL